MEINNLLPCHNRDEFRKWLFENYAVVKECWIRIVGKNKASDVMPNEANLYELPLAYYDSEIEHEIEKIDIKDKITVFGKLPKRSIKIPTYLGKTTSPDFMYAIERGNDRRLILLIEAKSEDKRESDIRALNAQKKYFESLFKKSEVAWEVVTRSEDVMKELKNTLKLLNFFSLFKRKKFRTFLGLYSLEFLINKGELVFWFSFFRFSVP